MKYEEVLKELSNTKYKRRTWQTDFIFLMLCLFAFIFALFSLFGYGLSALSIPGMIYFASISVFYLFLAFMIKRQDISGYRAGLIHFAIIALVNIFEMNLYLSALANTQSNSSDNTVLLALVIVSISTFASALIIFLLLRYRACFDKSSKFGIVQVLLFILMILVSGVYLMRIIK